MWVTKALIKSINTKDKIIKSDRSHRAYLNKSYNSTLSLTNINEIMLIH